MDRPWPQCCMMWTAAGSGGVLGRREGCADDGMQEAQSLMQRDWLPAVWPALQAVGGTAATALGNPVTGNGCRQQQQLRVFSPRSVDASYLHIVVAALTHPWCPRHAWYCYTALC